jgi:peptidyl-prolyl cis-trans isomerase C
VAAVTTVLDTRYRRAVSARPEISVNGTVIAHAAIARETQHHPSRTGAASWQAAAEALVIRELLLQEARALEIAGEPLTDAAGRRETEEEAQIRVLLDEAVRVPQPTDAELRRYYEQNRSRFRAPELIEARHILIAARASEPANYARAREKAEAIANQLARDPDSFDRFARDHSDCASAGEGGWLGQLTPDTTTPEFAAAVAALAEGETTRQPVETRYGFHVIRLERRIPSADLPFEAVADRLRDYLSERVRHKATAQYVARLVLLATIVGIEMPDAEAHRVGGVETDAAR